MTDTSTPTRDPLPALWRVEPPVHFDSGIPLWIKLAVVALATLAAFLWIDHPLAAWVMRAKPIPDISRPHEGWKGTDIGRELMMLEQFGQWTSAVLIVVAVGLIDRVGGRRKALAIAVACLATVAITHLLKDVLGRSRPNTWVEARDVFGFHVVSGGWVWGGPVKGFSLGAKWGSFPSGHATAAFALASALAWFYPGGRGLFMALACITAAQRVLHGAHFLSDVIAGMAIGVATTRTLLHLNLPGRILAMVPPWAHPWWDGAGTAAVWRDRTKSSETAGNRPED